MSNFRKVYPPNGKNLFDGGLNSKFAQSIIEDNESPDCLNVVFDDGSVSTRPGFPKVNTASVGSYVCEGLYTRRGLNSAETMCAFYNGSGYTLDSTSLVTIPSAQSVFTAGGRVGSTQMENHIFFGNGGVTPYKYNGTAFTRHGVPQATNPISFNSNGAGNPNGDYRYKITYVNSQSVEGNPSTASTTFSVVSKIISLTSIPVAPQSHGVSSRNIYRTVAGGSSYLRVATISDNTTTSYNDNITDASLGAAAPSDKGEPPNYSTIIYHKNRIFCNDANNPQYVWYSDLNEPFTFGAASFEILGDGSTDFVKGFAVQDDSLVVFCEQNPWLIYMASTTPSDWKKIKAKSAYSTKSPHGLFNYNNKVGFPAVQNHKFVGIGALAGDTIEPSATFLSISTAGGELKTDRIETDMYDIQSAYIGNISSIVFQNKAYISMTKGAGSTTNNRVYVMDFDLDSVSKNQKETWVPWSGLNAAQFSIFNGSLYYGTSTATGFLYKMNEGTYSDDGAAINSYFWTKEFSGYKGEESYSKDFRWFNFLVDQPGAYFMDIAIKTDSDSGSGTNYSVSIDPESSLWGTMVWGSDTWGGGADQDDKRVYIPETRGKRIQFKFSNQNTNNQRFKVHWFNFTYNLKGPR